MDDQVSQNFKSYFPNIVEEIVTEPGYQEMEQVNQRFEECLNYNGMKSYPWRGLLCTVTVQQLSETYNTSEENSSHIAEKGIIAGWCVELLCDAVKITEDYVSGRTQRDGKPVWHLNTKIGALAFNDTLLITGGVFNLLKRHFSREAYYDKLVAVFKDAQFKKSLSNVLAHRTEDLNTRNDFDLGRYHQISSNDVEMDYYLPIITALLVVNPSTIPSDMEKDVKLICCKVGLLRKLRHELDIISSRSPEFNEFLVSRSWAFNTAMDQCDKDQRKALLTTISDCGTVKNYNKLYKIFHDFNISSQLKETVSKLSKEIQNEVENSQFPEMEIILQLFDKILFTNSMFK